MVNVMSHVLTVYSACGALCRYWADIDTQLRRVGYEKQIKVRLLISCWASTQPVMFPFLKSLASVYDPKSKLDIQVVRSSSVFLVLVMSPLPLRKEVVHVMMHIV